MDWRTGDYKCFAEYTVKGGGEERQADCEAAATPGPFRPVCRLTC